MRHTLMLFAVVLSMTHAACSAPGALRQEPSPQASSPEKPTQKPETDLPKKVLVGRITEILMDEIYPLTDPVRTPDMDEYAQVVVVRVIDPKLVAAANKIADVFLAAGPQDATQLVVTNKTSRDLFLRVGPGWMPKLELPAGYNWTWKGPGAQYLDDVKVEILEKKP